VYTQPPYGRGIHITNTTGWPASRIIGNLIADNAYMGIGTNMAGRVVIADNIVTRNGDRGIAVVEMSDVLVANNTVENNGGNGIYISDRSMVTACDNLVVNSLPTIEDSQRYGNGITIDFGSEVELYRNTVTGNANYGISIMEGSSVTLGDNDVDGNGGDALWRDNTSRTVGSIVAFDSCSR
jgi:parallel beta-helix repeat protein